MSIYQLALVLGFNGYWELIKASEMVAELKFETIWITPLPCGSYAVWSDKDVRAVDYLPNKNRARKVAMKLVRQAV